MMSIEYSVFRRNNEEFFEISITKESDLSDDGGHTFEDVTNEADLTKPDAIELIKKLKSFVGGY